MIYFVDSNLPQIKNNKITINIFDKKNMCIFHLVADVVVN